MRGAPIVTRPAARVAALVLGVGLVAGASGCVRSTPPTPAQYASVADAVCSESDDHLDDLAKRHDAAVAEAAVTGEDSANTARPERWMRARVIPAYQSMSAQLKGIQPPSDDHQYLADLYADLDRLIGQLNSYPSRGRELISEDPELRDRFASYGMEICGTV